MFERSISREIPKLTLGFGSTPEAEIVILRPTKGQIRDAQLMELLALVQPSYIERLFIDLWKIHKEDHCKGGTIVQHERERHGNIPREVTKMFICLPTLHSSISEEAPHCQNQ